jgi:hypothetical protein
MIVPIVLSRHIRRMPVDCAPAQRSVPSGMPSASDFFTWLSGAADFAEKHPTITITIAALFALFGTPEIGSSEKPWIKSRPGLGWFAVKWLEKYAERTQVWRDLKAEAEALATAVKENSVRVLSLEKVSDWQTRVMLLIASTLKIDVTKTLDGSNVVAVSRESSADLSGEKSKKSIDAPAVPS